MPPTSSTRQRRRKRLAIIAAVVVLILAVVGVRIVMIQNDAAVATAQLDQAREQAMQAFDAGDYPTVLDTLGPYLENNPDDAEAAYRWGVARLKTPLSDQSHLGPAVQQLRRVLNLQPNHTEAAQALLSVYADYPEGVEEEALRLARRVLESKPDDTTALRARAMALYHAGKLQEGLDATEAALEKLPLNLEMHRVALNLMARLNQPGPVLLQRTEALRKAHPNDPRFELIEGYAHRVLGDNETAYQWAEQASLRPPPNEDYIFYQARFFDELNRFTTAQQYLEHQLNNAATPRLVQEIARRRFETRKDQAARDLIARLPQPLATELLTLDAIAAMRLAGPDADPASLPALQTLAERSPQTARALTIALTDTDDNDGIIAAATEANADNPADPYLLAILGDAQLRSDDTADAEATYQKALQRRPSWSKPWLGLAHLAMVSDEPDKAAVLAQHAVLRDPEFIPAQMLLVFAVGDDPESLSPENADELVRRIDLIQNAVPGDTGTLLLKAQVLAAQGKTAQASRAIDDTLASPSPPTAEQLLQLTELDRHYKLDRADQIQRVYTDQHGISPEIAAEKALELVRTKTPDEALAAYDRMAPADINPADRPNWQLRRALLTEQLGLATQATQAWAKLGSAWPENRTIQMAVLRSPAARLDRAAIDQAIDRLKQIDGDNTNAWKVERARWLLTDDQPADHAQAALDLVNDVIDEQTTLALPFILRGNALRLLNRPEDAIADLQKAINLAPADTRARLELAGAYQETNRPGPARDEVLRLLKQPDLSGPALRSASQLLINLRAYADAALPLQRLEASGQAAPQDVLALAQIYRQLQQTDKALLLLDDVLADPSPQAIVFAADLYASAGKTDQAAATLARLDSLGLPALQTQTLKASYLSAHGTPDAAEAAFLAITEDQPDQPEAWLNLVRFQLQAGQIGSAVASASRAMKTLSAEQAPGLAAFDRMAKDINSLSQRSDFTAIFFAVLDDDRYRKSAEKLVQMLAKPGDGLTDQLVEMADNQPGFEALQLLAIQSLRAEGRFDESLRRAAVAIERFPESPEPARLAAETYALRGQWSQALIAAEAWTQRSGVNRAAADRLTALIHRKLNRPSQGLSLLEPYRGQITANPAAFPELTREFAILLAATGRDDQARSLLEPLLSQGATWGSAWLETAATAIANTPRAGQWLDAAERAFPEDATDQRLALAQAWVAVGRRDSYQPFIQRGKALAAALAQRDDASAALYFFLGSLAEADRDLDAAESAYRRSIALDPDAVTARNNLAMVLCQQPDANLSEAVALAEKVVELVPSEPNFLDTLAFVYNKAGQHAQAQTAINRAIELDPGNPQWQVRLNEIKAHTP